ncbi:MAG: hypothetical protein SXV54_00245 [Chloroflexota bacterium]|nr:hypothetical protein [Chloroflexota bacterium]
MIEKHTGVGVLNAPGGRYAQFLDVLFNDNLSPTLALQAPIHNQAHQNSSVANYGYLATQTSPALKTPG